MTEDPSGSSVPRLLLGRKLRALRDESGVTAVVAAEEVGIARATLWRMEKGDRRARYKVGDVEKLARIYDADDETIALMSALAKATRVKSWISKYADVLPPNFDLYVDLEAHATHFRWYEADLVPGLLQTEAYARAIMTARRSLPLSDLERRVQVRTTRKRILTRHKPATFEFMLSETILLRPVGDPELMANQLHTINKLGELPNVTVRVVPLNAGAHLGTDTGAFEVLDFPQNPRLGCQPTTAYIDQVGGYLFLDRPEEVKLYEETFDDLLTHALDEPASKCYVEEAARRFSAQ